MTTKKNSWIHYVLKQHNEWIKIAKTFGCGDESEDVVQNFYIHLIKYGKKRNVLIEGTEKLNIGYLWICLRNDAYKYMNKKDKNMEVRPYNWIWTHGNNMSYVPEKDEFNKAYEIFWDNVLEEMDDWEWFDRSLFSIYDTEKESIRGVSKKTSISCKTIFLSLKESKEKLRVIMHEDYEDLWNGDYEHIKYKKNGKTKEERQKKRQRYWRHYREDYEKDGN